MIIFRDSIYLFVNIGFTTKSYFENILVINYMLSEKIHLIIC